VVHFRAVNTTAPTGFMHLGVFEVAGPQVGGTLSWPHPRSDSIRYHELDYWLEMARMLDDAGFDFLFFADGYGFPSIAGDLPATAARGGINFPGMDPTFIVPVLAHATRRLGFVVTASTGLDHPVQTARRFATLDHLTGGRIGWNIVTGASQNVLADLFGHPEMMRHDDRYAVADEYVDLALRLWEGCWEDDALVADRERQVFVDPDKLHRVEHVGKHFRSSGYLTVDPSPQRTPTLFQAGTSAAGRTLAARYAECVFVQATTREQTAANVADIRDRAEQAGRDPQSLKIMVGVSVTVSESAAEATAQRAAFDALQSDEIVNVLYAGNTGVDLMSLDPDRPLSQALGDGGVVGQMGQSNLERFLGSDGNSGPTVRQILDDLRGKGTRGFQVTGDAIGVSDQLEELDLCADRSRRLRNTGDTAAAKARPAA
jgi:FMN-dependent oxidoreductase (nitrilotriacetate monooxygenase family)